MKVHKTYDSNFARQSGNRKFTDTYILPWFLSAQSHNVQQNDKGTDNVASILCCLCFHATKLMKNLARQLQQRHRNVHKCLWITTQEQSYIRLLSLLYSSSSVVSIQLYISRYQLSAVRFLHSSDVINVTIWLVHHAASILQHHVVVKMMSATSSVKVGACQTPDRGET